MKHLSRLLASLALGLSLWSVSAVAFAHDGDKGHDLPEVPVALLVPMTGALLYGVRVLRNRHTPS